MKSFHSLSRIAAALAVLLCCGISLAETVASSGQSSRTTGASAPTERVDTYDVALERAKSTGNDIVVFQRGSDWNRLGETLYANLWMKDELVRDLGPGFILVAVDHPEAAGGRAVAGQCSAVQCGITGLSDFQIGNSAPLRLAKLADEGSPLPQNQIILVKSKEHVPFEARADSTWVAQPGKNNPARDILTLTLRAGDGGNVVRLDFPTDASLPGGGPGLAGNGNFFISEVAARVGDRPVKLTAAWANAATGNNGAWQAIDGIENAPTNGWNAAANAHQRRTLLLVLGQNLTPGTILSLQLTCQSSYGQHVPGAIRGAVRAGSSLDSDAIAVYKAQAIQAKNATFSWWDRAICPRIALLDSQGRAIAAENKPRLELTCQSLAARIGELRSVREQRDAIWAKAEASEDPAKAALLQKSLELLGIANWAGNDNCYKFIHDEMKAADPQDESGAVRWLSFSADPHQTAPGLETAGKALGAKRYEDALAEVDKQLADPRNKALDHDRIQRIMLYKFQIYRQWPGHTEEEFEVQRQIAALDATTYLGIGAVGYAAMYHRSPAPLMPYGWGPPQLKAGSNTWDIANTSLYFDHAGTYQITLAATAGKDPLTIHRIAIMDGGTVMADVPETAANVVSAGHKVRASVNLKSWSSTHNYVLHIEAEAQRASADNTGNITIEPEFDPPAITLAAPAPTDVSSEMTAALASGDIAGWEKKLDEVVLARGATALAAPAGRAALAQAELIRVCQPDKIAAIAKHEGGALFLARLMSDTDWLEGFLNSGPANRAEALENLRFLHQYAAADFANPIVKRLATAMSLSVGETYSRYRLFDRFKQTQRALQQGLLHVDFETYTVREMRFAVYLPGTERDYQYLLDDRQTTNGDYFGACWAIAYRDRNDYGFSVQGWGYTEPWQHYYGPGTGSRPLIAQRHIGGVCGTLSEYGVAAARTHGLMAITVGQPGHCAYVVRVGQTWGIGNDVFGAAATGFEASGWDGTGYSVAAQLWEPVEADREHFMASTRLAWLARAQLARGSEKAAGAWIQTYERAIDAQPLNYGTWIEYVNAMIAAPNTPPATLLSLGRRAADLFAPYHQPAMALAHRCFEKAAPSMKPAQRLAWLLDLQRLLSEEKATHLAAYDVGENFEWEANHLGEASLEPSYFTALLQIHHSADPHRTRFFTAVMSWGGKHFASKPALAAQYYTSLEQFYRLQKSPEDLAALKQTITTGIRASSEKSDAQGFAAWTDMAARLLPPIKPEDIHLNAAQAAAAPKIIPFEGELLSADGMLQTSSACGYDRPLSYRQLLTGGIGGWMDTNNQDAPWAQVKLRTDSLLSGIVLVNRYELGPKSPEFQWQAPLSISVSMDGKSWKSVASIDTAEAVFRIDLKSQALRARYVRVERPKSADPSKPLGRFHFRDFLVYGTSSNVPSEVRAR